MKLNRRPLAALDVLIAAANPVINRAGAPEHE